jgi:hypothetical protein
MLNAITLNVTMLGAVMLSAMMFLVAQNRTLLADRVNESLQNFF